MQKPREGKDKDWFLPHGASKCSGCVGEGSSDTLQQASTVLWSKRKDHQEIYQLKLRIEEKKKERKKTTPKRWPPWKQEPNQKSEKEQCPKFNIKQPQNS